MAYYMRYAIACYGSFIYIADNPCSGPCWICCRSRCCSQKSPHIVNVFHDDRCQSNTEAVKNWTNLTDDDFIYISFCVEYKETPFFVAVDRSKNTVVVALRGTWSVQDGLTDFSGRGAKMAVPGVDDAYCHTAVLERANSVLDKLNNMEILETAFSKLNADAKLVITGHSLGSGIASVLSILLRPKYPLLMCYAFSPMGCCLSPNLSKYTEEFICSPTLGADMIARTNMFTLTELKVNLLRALIQIDIPKYQILARGFLRFLCCCCLLQSSSETDQLLLSARLGPLYSDEDELNVQVCGLEESLQNAEADLETVRRMHWPFKLPGQLLHIVETNDSPGCCNCPPAYQAYWTGTSTFDKIIMSSSMLSDHLPDNILHALDQMHDLQVEPM